MYNPSPPHSSSSDASGPSLELVFGLVVLLPLAVALWLKFDVLLATYWLSAPIRLVVA